MARQLPVTQQQISSVNARVQESGAGQGAAKTSAALASFTRNRRDEYQAQAIENAYLNGQTTLTRDLDILEKRYERDPDMFLEAFEDYKESFMGELNDPNMSARFGLQLEKAGQTALARITSRRNQVIDEQSMFDNMTTLHSIKNTMPKVIQSMASEDPVQQLAAAQEWQEIQGRGLDVLNATKADGTPLFSPEFRAKELAMLKETSLFDYMDARFQNAENKKEFYEEYKKGNVFIKLPNAGESTIKIANNLMTDLQSELGVSKEIAAGIVGNLAYESGGFMQMQEIQPLVPGSRGGFGYAQWTGPRREQFEAWAEANNLDPRSYAANKGFLIHELKNTSEGRVLKKLQGIEDHQEAANIFMNEFLRPGIKNANRRKAWAETVYTNEDKEGYDLVNVRDAVGKDTAGLIDKTAELYVKEEEQALIEQNEAPLREQLKNETAIRNQLLSEETPLQEKRKLLVKASRMAFEGGVRKEFIPEATKYLNSYNLSDANVPVQEKLEAFSRLQNRLSDVRVAFGGKPDEIDKMKISAEGMAEYQKYQTEVLEDLNAKRITEKEANQLLSGIDFALTTAIENKDTKGVGLTIFKGIQDPYSAGIKKIEKYLENQGRPNSVSEKKAIFEAFAESLGAFDENGNYVVGEYQSTGNKTQDDKAIEAALQSAIQASNINNFRGLVSAQNPPNYMVQPVMTQSDIDAEIAALEKELGGGN